MQLCLVLMWVMLPSLMGGGNSQHFMDPGTKTYKHMYIYLYIYVCVCNLLT